jgi:ketosteroid isomerase-like protein
VDRAGKLSGDAVAEAHPNVERLRALFAAFRKGDIKTITDTIDDGAVWHFPGRRGKLAGSHRGRAGVMEFLMKVPALTGGTFRLELEDVLANDTNAAAIFRGSAQRGGKILDNPTVLRMKLKDGRVTEVWEFVWDLNHVEDFWA